MRSLFILAGICFVLAAVPVMAADIVTVPTANQLKAGEVDVAYYFLDLDFPPGAPTGVNFLTLYVGVTDQLEIDAHRDEATGGPELPGRTIWNATWLLLKEDQRNPNVVIGGRNLDGEGTKASWFISAAKTVMAPVGGPPSLQSPVVRLHLSVGTEDDTLLGETRHDGIFGGVQAMLSPQVGLIALHDGQDFIGGLTYTKNPKWPTFKGGVYGDHTWVGVSYTFNVKQ